MAVQLVSDTNKNNPVNPAFIAARAESLLLQSPYFFLRDLNIEAQQLHFGTGAAQRFGTAPMEEVVNFSTPSAPGQWLLSHLQWDTAYFGIPTYRLVTGLAPTHIDGVALIGAATELRNKLILRGSFYAFSVVPAEDLTLLQALTGAGWQLIETRLHYYHNGVTEFQYSRHAVRAAVPAEASRIGKVAAANRNYFDRYHSDPWFGPARADAYLDTYAQATVNGLADIVLVPDEVNLSLDSFLAISDLRTDTEILGAKMSRILLTAVGPKNRGWHVKLVAEALHRAREMGHQYILMTTQATNLAVFRTSEKLGFKLGAVSHVLACHS